MVERWREFERRWPDNDRTTHAVRRYFGLTAFDRNSYSASAGNPLIVPHDERANGQEELYLVIERRARFVCDGEEVELGVGEVLVANPEMHREAYALESPTTLFLVGGLPGARTSRRPGRGGRPLEVEVAAFAGATFR